MKRLCADATDRELSDVSGGCCVCVQTPCVTSPKGGRAQGPARHLGARGREYHSGVSTDTGTELWF